MNIKSFPVDGLRRVLEQYDDALNGQGHVETHVTACIFIYVLTTAIYSEWNNNSYLVTWRNSDVSRDSELYFFFFFMASIFGDKIVFTIAYRRGYRKEKESFQSYKFSLQVRVLSRNFSYIFCLEIFRCVKLQ